MVPAECRDPIAHTDTEPAECERELLCAADHLRVGIAVEALIWQPGDDLLVAVERLGALEHRRDRELVVHH